jgi:hypothetical protein
MGHFCNHGPLPGRFGEDFVAGYLEMEDFAIRPKSNAG